MFLSIELQSLYTTSVVGFYVKPVQMKVRFQVVVTGYS